MLFIIALVAFFITVSIAIILYFKPRFMTEGFTTVSIDKSKFPTCFLRSIESQQLAADLAHLSALPPNSYTAMAYREFLLILQKILCIDADVSSAGAGSYSTSLLPYATSHDVEPATSFVGRCLKQSVRAVDIDMEFGKLEDRGIELLNIIYDDIVCGNLNTARKPSAIAKFSKIVTVAKKTVESYCLKNVNLDIPAGVRDPGYFIPPEIETLHQYSGMKQYL